MPTPSTTAPLAAALLLAGATLTAVEEAPSPPPETAPAISEAPPMLNQAQQLVLANDLMGKVPAGSTLEYRFTRRGKDMKDYQDRVKVTVARVAPDGRRDLTFDFLSEGHHLDFHPATDYRGNPVPIHFLERDIKEMAEATEGDIGYFRNRLRKAFAQPQVQPVKITVDGHELDGTQVTVMPYVDDPNIANFKTYANKRYDFLFAEQLPGGLYQIRTTVPADGGDSPVIEEQLTFDHLAPAG
ncbi:MAG TPA: hypothetical protein VES73_05645 [Lamprocystis sp. (in: g-proteobacteria)]|nr:hypothetical protein [Lamprocystis sp. (in: g-proteobacteria)]